MAGADGFLDFDVLVGRWEGGLEIRVLGSPAGETAAVRSAVDLRWAAPANAPPAAGARREVGAAAHALDLEPRDFGMALFGAVMQGEALIRYRESLRRASAAGAGLRIVLRVDDGVGELPWELMFDPDSRRFLSLDPATPVVRCIEMPARGPAPAIRGPLRMLVAVSSPTGASPLDEAGELGVLEAALGPLIDSGVLVLVRLVDATLSEIRRSLQREDVHIFHYIGHGTRRPDGLGAVDLTSADGSVDERTGEELGMLLAGARTLRLAVLNSCHGAGEVADNPFAATAAALVKAGVPAVVAMRSGVSNPAAIAFAKAFYSELAAGSRIEQAVTRGRGALFDGDRSTSAEWPVAALYLGSSLEDDLTASPMAPIDRDVQFSVSRPAQLRAERWESTLLIAHRSTPYEGPSGETIDPLQQVAQRVAGFFGADLERVSTTSLESAGAVPRGASLLIVLDLPDVDCEPRRASLTWTGQVGEARFEIRARASRIGTAVSGWLRVYCGALLLAETVLAFDVVEDAVAVEPKPQPVTRFRRIFPCFSPLDRQLVANVAAVAEALGDELAKGIIEGRSEETPNDWMLPLIDEADVFQLFWSSHSMHSTTCQRQWERALASQRAGFIRAMYWEQPFPTAAGLPPQSFESLRFVQLPTAVTTPTQTLWQRAPSAPVPAPSPPAPLAPAAQRKPAKTVRAKPPRPPLPGDLICGQCGEANPAERRFCTRCGEPLARGEAVPRAAAAHRRRSIGAPTAVVCALLLAILLAVAVTADLNPFVIAVILLAAAAAATAVGLLRRHGGRPPTADNHG